MTNIYLSKYKEILTLNIILGKDREWAEEMAYSHALALWLNKNHEKGDSRFCLECGQRHTDQSPLLPFGTPADQWIHSGVCWANWYDKKINRAKLELGEIGLKPPQFIIDGTASPLIDNMDEFMSSSSTYWLVPQSDPEESSDAPP